MTKPKVPTRTRIEIAAPALMAGSATHMAKAECERLFQNGGPKVYFQDEPGGPLRPSNFSARRSVEIRDVGQAVYARQKNRATGSYEWRCMGLGGVAVGSPELAAHPIAKANAASWPTYSRKSPNQTRSSTMSKLKALTALDLAKSVVTSDAWDRVTQRPTLNSCADLCSHIGRGLLGRRLLAGGENAVYLDLENGHYLRVTLLDKAPAPKSEKRCVDALEVLQELVDADKMYRANGTHGYNLKSYYAKAWNRARKVLSC